MNTLLFILAVFGFLYCLLAYAVAALVIWQSKEDGDYDNKETELWEDIFTLVFAPIAVPYQIFRNN